MKGGCVSGLCVSCHQRTNPRDNSPATVLSSTLALSQVAWAHGDGSACRGRTLPHVKHRTGMIMAARGYAARRGRPGRGGRPQSPLRQHGDNAPASPSLSARRAHDPALLVQTRAAGPLGPFVFLFWSELFGGKNAFWRSNLAKVQLTHLQAVVVRTVRAGRSAGTHGRLQMSTTVSR